MPFSRVSQQASADFHARHCLVELPSSRGCVCVCLTSVLCSTLLVFLLLLLVCLVGYYWDLEVAHERLVITGEATLSGAVGSVGGLRGKLLAAYHHLIVATSDSSFVTGSACVIVPSDNTSATSGVLVENPSVVNARAMVKVRGARGGGDGTET